MRLNYARIARPAISLLMAFAAGVAVTLYFIERYDLLMESPIVVTFPPSLQVQQNAWPRNLIDQMKPEILYDKQQAEIRCLIEEDPSEHGAIVPMVPESSVMIAGDIRELQKRHLLLPLSNLRTKDLRNSFDERRGNHIHEAIDILAPRNTAVVAVDDGSIGRLWYSVPGGNTIYQFDSEQKYEYYYAHLERYADGLKEGDLTKRGQVIGYVGTSGNAPKNTPHLHFTIFKLTKQKNWWEGTAINPHAIYKKAGLQEDF